MRFFVCIAGLPVEAVEGIAKESAASFTGENGNSPIVRPIKEPFCYRQGMSDYYLQQLEARIAQTNPSDDISVILAYADYGGYTSSFVEEFFPFAITSRFDPFYPSARPANTRRAALTDFLRHLRKAVEILRVRAALVRDCLSGQNFSPLTLPVRNFASAVLRPTLSDLFFRLGAANTTEAARSLMQESRSLIEDRHPIIKREGYIPYFEDDRGLRFKSPGRYTHGFSRNPAVGHKYECFINNRVRLGGPLKANFHYDCEYERHGLDEAYPNCHGIAIAPAQTTHVNIAPNDAIR